MGGNCACVFVCVKMFECLYVCVNIICVCVIKCVRRRGYIKPNCERNIAVAAELYNSAEALKALHTFVSFYTHLSNDIK